MTAAAAAPPLPSTGRPPWLERALPGATGRGVTVALVDSGLDPAWDCGPVGRGAGLLARGGGFRLRRSADTADRNGHGTACAAILHAAAPEAAVVPIRVFDRRLETSVPVLLAALDWAVERGVDVVNLSLGTLLPAALEPLYGACERARRRGVVVVAAADAGEASFPAVFDNVLGVAGGRFAGIYDHEYRRDAAVEVVAQGLRRVLRFGGGWTEAEGPSYAAPQVAALAALLLEARPAAGLDGLRAWLERHALGAAGRAGGEPEENR